MKLAIRCIHSIQLDYSFKFYYTALMKVNPNIIVKNGHFKKNVENCVFYHPPILLGLIKIMLREEQKLKESWKFYKEHLVDFIREVHLLYSIFFSYVKIGIKAISSTYR